MEQLSGLDASFLYLETPTHHMQVEIATVFDPSTVPGGYSFAKMQAQIDARTHQSPVFRRLLVEVPFRLGHPVWVDDPHFDIDYHIRRTAVPSPGGLRELADLVGDFASRQLDRSKPLWEIWIVEGLEHGRIAVIAKMHHSTVDGMSGAALLSVLFDLEVDPGPEPEVPEVVADGHIPTSAELISEAMAARLLPTHRAHPRHPAHRPPPASTCDGSATSPPTGLPSPGRRCRCPPPGRRSTAPSAAVDRWRWRPSGWPT